MMLLAETMFDLSTIAVIAVVAVTLAGIVGFTWLIQQMGTIKSFIREVAGVRETQQVEISGGTVETSGRVRMATWEELQDVKDSLNKIETKFEDGIKSLTIEGSRRAASIHGRVDKVAVELAGVKATGEATHGGQILLGQKVDTLILELRKERK